MRVLGIDPGLEKIGYAIVEKANLSEKLIACGLIKTSSKNSSPERLFDIFCKLEAVIKKNKPSKAGVERLYFAKNIKTAFSVAEARGVILMCLKKNAIPIIELTPLEVKMALTNYGRADKKQVSFMVQKILRLSSPITQDDASDAAAIAIASIYNDKT